MGRPPTRSNVRPGATARVVTVVHEWPPVGLSALDLAYESVSAQARAVVDQAGCLRMLGVTPALQSPSGGGISSLPRDMRAVPIMEICHVYRRLSAEERPAVKSALRAALDAADATPIEHGFASLLRVADENDATRSASQGENLNAIDLFHVLDEQERARLAEILLRRSHQDLQAGDSLTVVKERYGLSQPQELAALEELAAGIDVEAGRAAYSGENVCAVAARFDFQTDAGRKKLQMIACLALAGREGPETKNVTTLAEKHGIDDPDAIYRLECHAISGRAGRAVAASRSTVSHVAGSYGITTPAGIESLELFAIERRISKELFKGANVRQVAAREGITSPNALLQMEYLAIENLSVTAAPNFYQHSAETIGAHFGIESQAGLSRLSYVLELYQEAIRSSQH